MKRLLLFLVCTVLAPLIASAENIPEKALIQKRCISLEVLEICLNNECTQAPCSDQMQCHDTSNRGATCLPEMERRQSLLNDGTINLNYTIEVAQINPK